ncbi:MAG: hypothetical protein ACI9AT_001250 [Ulvibacter sp.]|jgi:hypothetical protein
MSEKIINRSLLIATAKVLNLFSNEDSDSKSMGEMREMAFGELPREDMLKAIEYFKSPSEYTINEDAENI